MSEETKQMKEQLKELQETVKRLIELENQKAKAEIARQEQQEISPPPQKMTNEELERELREHHLGELVSYAVKKHLIPKGIDKEKD